MIRKDHCRKSKKYEKEKIRALHIITFFFSLQPCRVSKSLGDFQGTRTQSYER